MSAPVQAAAPVAFVVGPGVVEAMRATGDEPRGHEVYTHDPATSVVLYSETHGRDALYRWTPADGVRRLPFVSAASPSGRGASSEVAEPPGPAQGAGLAVAPAPAPVGEAGAGPVPWDRVELIRAGFSTADAWFAEFRERRQVRALVWHAMEGYLAGALARWNTGAAGAHLCILRDGTVVLTCPIEAVAWGAGTHNRTGQDGYGRTPFWRTHNVNAYACQVELEGFVISGYTEEQIRAAIRVAAWVTATYRVVPEHTVDQVPGHHLHAELSSTRSDPGPLFPLARIVASLTAGEGMVRR